MKWIALILIGLGMILISTSLVSAYTASNYDNVTLTLETGYTSPDYDNVTLVLDEALGFGTLAIVWDEPTADDNHTTLVFKQYRFSVSCTGGSCGDVNVTLDPIIQLQDENMDDSWVDHDSNADKGICGVGEMLGDDDAAASLEPAFKFNTSAIPANATILDAQFYMWVSGEAIDVGESFNATAHHLYQSFNWTEGNTCGSVGCEGIELCIDASGRPSTGTDYNASYETELAFVNGMAVDTWYNWNVTKAVEKSYNDGDSNISIFIHTVNTGGSPAVNDEVNYRTKEYAGAETYTKPQLNITYSVPGDATNPTATNTLPTNGLTFDFGALMNFSLICTDNVNVSVLQLWGNWSGWHANQTNATATNNTPWNISVSGISDWNHTWAAWCNDTNGNEDYAVNWTFIINSTPSVTKNVINNTAGATPFYHNGTTVNYECGAMSSGSTCTAIFWVNATGTVNNSYEFFANATSNNASVNQSNTSMINITIIAVAVPTDSCDCPSPAANWFMSIADNCNVTSNCYNDGYNVSFENGTSGDMVNCSAMIVADNFYMQDAGSGTIIQTDPTCYLNTS